MKKIFLTLIIGMILIATAMAIPIPEGVSGTVFLNKHQKAPAKTPLFIKNLDNDFELLAYTDEYGKYSASIIGKEGDTIFIKAQYEDSEAHISVKLQGIMRNVNLYLYENITEEEIKENIEISLLQGDVKEVELPQIDPDTVEFDKIAKKESLFTKKGHLYIGGILGIIALIAILYQLGVFKKLNE